MPPGGSLTMITKGLGKTYRLLGADGSWYLSPSKGLFGGNSRRKIYGTLDCFARQNGVSAGYARARVFFMDEPTAIAAGYRPCGRCMRKHFSRWKAGGEMGTEAYPWLITP
jgi:Metal binding domain of Ada